MMSRELLSTVVISDLDSTICQTEHRHEFGIKCLTTGEWEQYSLKCVGDSPILGSITTLRLLYPYHRIHLCTGRSEIARDFTLKWLDSYEVPFDELMMFDSSVWDNKPSNGKLKVSYIRELKSRGFQVVLFLEDWEETVRDIEAEGIPVLCVNPRNVNGPGSTHL